MPGEVFVQHRHFQKVMRVPWELHKLLRSSTQSWPEPGAAFADNAPDAEKIYKNILKKMYCVPAPGSEYALQSLV